mmetsp:Transcript_31144/g.38461  ORF Transcript_31144/g.38461 Transcript_31144/m.38461 type:complete len:222 (+) Transcript_31144:339-1004(+)
MMFKALFGEHNLVTLQRIYRRKRALRILNIVVYLIIGTLFVVLTVDAILQEFKQVKADFFRFTFCVSAIIMTIFAYFSLYALWFIQRSSKIFEQLGIFANVNLFRVYTCSWVATALTYIALSITYFILRLSEDAVTRDKSRIVVTFLNTSGTVWNTCINLTILFTYLKFSYRLESSLARAVRDTLKGSFVGASASGGPDQGAPVANNVRRYSAERRLIAYR